VWREAACCQHYAPNTFDQKTNKKIIKACLLGQQAANSHVCANAREKHQSERNRADNDNTAIKYITRAHNGKWRSVALRCGNPYAHRIAPHGSMQDALWHATPQSSCGTPINHAGRG
jgi:hypothetical protein